jgi:hypothetical protein
VALEPAPELPEHGEGFILARLVNLMRRTPSDARLDRSGVSTIPGSSRACFQVGLRLFVNEASHVGISET